MKNLFVLYLNKRKVVTVSCESTLPVFAFGSAKIPSSFLRDLAFLTRYLETSNSFIVFSIVQLSGVKVNSLTFSFHDNTKCFSFISPTNLFKSLHFSTRVSGCNSSAEISIACATFSSISTLMCFNLFLPYEILSLKDTFLIGDTQ